MQEYLKTQYEQYKNKLLASKGSVTLQEREHAWQYFLKTGLPTTRQENFKYTDFSKLGKTSYDLSWRDDDVSLETIFSYVSDKENPRFVFINGYFSQKHSYLPHKMQTKLTMCNLACAKADELVKVLSEPKNFKSAFTALNTAFYQDGYFMIIHKNAMIENPIELLFLHHKEASSMAHIKNKIILEESASATIVEHHVALDDTSYFKTYMTEAELSKNSHLHYYRLQAENENALHVSQLTVAQTRDSQFDYLSVDVGGKLVRQDVDVNLVAKNSSCNLQGIYIAHQKQHIDNHTLIAHQSPYTTSRENFKGIIDDKARAVFNGCVIVHEGAFKSDAEQQNANLLLSNEAEIDTKPQLEILNDDVKCSHGATVGQLDENAIFYLCSRGLSLLEAKQLLTFGFARSLLSSIHHTSVQQKLTHTVLAKLGAMFSASRLI